MKERHTVKLPLRVNWGGGWSDTPPYCNENGGTVLNMAILLNGEKPVEVTLERTDERKVVFDSRDMDVHGGELQRLPSSRNPVTLLTPLHCRRPVCSPVGSSRRRDTVWKRCWSIWAAGSSCIQRSQMCQKVPVLERPLFFRRPA